MNIINNFVNIFLRTKEKLGFKLSDREELLILIDDANKVTSMLLRMERVKEKMKMRTKPDVDKPDIDKPNVDKPDVEYDKYIKMSPESSSKAKIKIDQSDENINLYIR